MLKRINSKYILENIIQFIKDKNIKLRLFIHSKYFQNLFDLTLYIFQKEYLHSLKNYNNKYMEFLYFHSDSEEKTNLKECYNKYVQSLDNISIDVIERDISELIIENTKEYSQIKIDIYSPLFFSFINNNILLDKLSINIPLNRIIKENLEDDYIKLFNRLNENSQNYESITISLYNPSDLDLLDKLNIRFSNIKYLYIEDTPIIDKFGGIMSIKLLNNKDLQNHLVLLNIDLNLYYIFRESFLITKFNNLKFLILNNVIFHKDTNINIKNMEFLKLNGCCNIILYSNDNKSNIKTLIIYSTEINNKKPEIQFPFLTSLEYDSKEKNTNFIDFNSLINLKNLNSFLELFLKIINSPLERIEIRLSNKFNNNILSQIGKISSIKEAILKNINIENELIFDIKEINNNLIRLTIDCNFEIKEFNFEKLINIFPNLEIFNFNYLFDQKQGTNTLLDNDIKIEENNACKINDLSLKFYHKEFGKIIFYINSFSTLKNLDLEDFDLNEKIFPIFNNKFNIVFNSLKRLNIINNNISSDIFDNIINNIKNCPVLEYLEIDEPGLQITKEKYFENIKKLLLSNIINIRIKIIDYHRWLPPGPYSKRELKKIFGNFNDKNHYYFEVYD